MIGGAALGCDGTPAALQVGPIGFTTDELGALGPSQQRLLADLTAFGMTIAEGRVDSLVGPYVVSDLRSLSLQRLAMELAADHAGLGEAELRLAYEGDPRHELVVRHLVVLSERWRPVAHRDSARAVAVEALERVQSGESFEAVASRYSDEPGAAERGGLLQPGREGSWVPEFWSAAASLEEGGVSGVVETEFGFHIIKLEERRRVPFAEVRDEVLGEVMDLPTALGRANEWARRRMTVAAVDSAAVRAWMSDPATAAVLVRWPDSLAVPDFDVEALAAVRPPSRGPNAETLRFGDLGRALRYVWGAAKTHLLMSRAQQMGIAPSSSQRAAIERRWRDRAGGWAAGLGFEEGQTPDEVKEAALLALATFEQGAAIARSEMRSVSSRLRELYPVSRPADAAAAGVDRDGAGR